MELWAVAIRRRAERWAGELLAEMGQNGSRAKAGGDPKSSSGKSNLISKKTLDQLGVTPDQSSLWQKLAKIKEPEFERRVQQAVEQIRSDFWPD
jgi:hypothetical protein